MSPADHLEALGLAHRRGELDAESLRAELDAFDLGIKRWGEQLLNLPLPAGNPQAGQLLEVVREALQLLADASARLRAEPAALEEVLAHARQAEAVLGQLHELAARGLRDLEDRS